jgi:hypothetical protein
MQNMLPHHSADDTVFSQTKLNLRAPLSRVQTAATPDDLSVPSTCQSVSLLDPSEFVKKKFQHTGPTIAEKSRSPTYVQYYAIIN